ncbi:MAG TPA: hypothetical protein VNK43_06440 [Gemmatimonadales bacterium]|nr:hypothetical protein [Gemmatimonadales bacterium]
MSLELARRALDRARGVVSPSLRGGPLRRAGVLLTGTTALGQILTLTAAPVITRIYDPSSFAAFAVYASSVVVLVVLCPLRYDLGVSVAREDREAAGLLGVSIAASWAMSLVLLAVLILSSVLGVRLRLLSDLGGGKWLLPLGAALGGTAQALTAWALRGRRYRSVGAARISQAAGQVGVQLGGAAAGGASIWLFLGDLVGRYAAIHPLLAVLRRDEAIRSARATRGWLLRHAVEHRRYPARALPAALLNSLGLQLPVLLLASLLHAPAVGAFALTQRVLAAPIALIGGVAGQIFVAEASSAAFDRERRVYDLFRSMSVRFFLAGLPAAVLLWSGGESIFVTVFGTEWAMAGRFASILAPVFLLQLVVTPVAQVFNLLGRLGHQLAWDVLRIVAVGGVILVAARHGDIEGVVRAFAACMVVLYAGLFVAYFRVSRRCSADA